MDSAHIMKGIGEFLAEFRLPILNNPGSGNELFTKLRSNGLPLDLQINYVPEKKVVVLIVYFSDRISMEQVKFPFQILNEFYAKMLLTHFAFSPVEHKMTLRSGYVLAEDKFNKKKFKEWFNQTIHDAVFYYPQLKKLMTEKAGNA